MEGSAGAPPQRVCPNCARISWATGPQCPYCRARFRRAQGVAPWMLALTAVIVLVGVAVMLLIAGDQLDKQLNDRVDEISRDFDADLSRMRDDVRKELDARLPAAGAVAPTPTPTPLATTTPTPTPEGELTPDPQETATAEPTATQGADDTGTGTPDAPIFP